MFNQKIFLYLFAGFLLFSAACNKMPNGGYPVYIRVDSVSVQTSALQGAPTHNIKALWAESGADNLGVYEVPCNFPVLQEGSFELVLSPGILKDGQNNQHMVYPFYTPFIPTVQAERNHEVVLNPVFRYKDGVKFPVNEDFELGNAFTGFARVTDDSLRITGSGSAALLLGAGDTSLEARLTTPVDLPAGSQIFLEFDYRSDVFFTVGVVGITGLVENVVPKLVIGPKEKTNKIYIELSNEIGVLATPLYKLYFRVEKTAATASATVLIDNIKLVHF